MRRPRVRLPGAAPGRVLEVPPVEARHLGRVLRRRPGDEVLALGDGGTTYRAVVEGVDSGAGGPRVVLRVEEPVLESPALVPWTVAVGLVRSSDMDSAVRLASELGLEGLIPLLCERSQVRGESSGKPARWRRIAVESAKQCGRAEPLRVGDPAGVRGILDRPSGDRWIAEPGAPAPDPRALTGPQGPREALFLVGPEGGFSPAEVDAARRAGARSLGFPTPVLRTPTAVVLIGALGVLVRGCGGGEGLERRGTRNSG